MRPNGPLGVCLGQKGPIEDPKHPNPLKTQLTPIF